MTLGRALLLMFVALECAGCAKPKAWHLTMPHPEGCYVEVFDSPGFMGRRDFINGPAKHADLSELRGAADWKRRVRSLKVGPGARMRAWAAENFIGPSLRLLPEHQAPTLSETFNAKIESIEIECQREQAAEPLGL